MKRVAIVLLAACALTHASAAAAHSGPPYPTVTDARLDPYVVSVWTDPDTTNDGTAAGRFWIVLSPNAAGVVPPITHATLTATSPAGATAPVDITTADRDGRTHFGALVFDHEGKYRVEVRLTGPAGTVTLDTTVDATYDLRPSPLVAALSILPFALVGILWITAMRRRARARAAAAGTPPSPTETIARSVSPPSAP
jgi:hypothetical protein